MTSKLKHLVKQLRANRQIIFLGKAIALLGALYLFCLTAPLLPPVFIALFWAVFSTFSAVGFAYHRIIKKTHNRSMHKKDGYLYRLDNGRMVCFAIAFVVSAIFIAGLVLQAPKWGLAEWLLALAAIPLYLLISFIIGKLLRKEYEPLFFASKTAFLSSLVLGIVLWLAYILILFLQPPVFYTSAAEAFLSAGQPFSESSSIIMVELGKLTALIDGMTSYTLSKIAETSFSVYLIGNILLSGVGFFGISTLASFCSIDGKELRRVYLPLDPSENLSQNSKPVKRYLIAAGVLPIILVTLFLVADFETSKFAETEEYTRAESLIRDQVGIAAYVLDGKYYDEQAVRNIIEEAKEESLNLSKDAENTLVPLINKACDERLKNVDSYLDWYYSLPADYERLAQIFTGTVEEGMKSHLADQLNKNVDDSELLNQFEQYVERAASLKNELMDELSQYELDTVPTWLINAKEELDPDFLSTPLEPTHILLSEGQRFLASGVAGIAGEIVANKLIQKVLAKPFFSKIVGRLTTTLTARGLGQAAGGDIGTVIAPGIGTAVGLAAATGLGILSDYLFLKADEMLNRTEYKEEIVAAIEDERAEMLAIVQRGL